MNAGANGGGGGAISPLDEVPAVVLERPEEDVSPMSQMQGVPPGMPRNEEEADAMLRMQLGNDPEKMRLMAREFSAKLNSMADSIDGGTVVELASGAPTIAAPAAATFETSVAPVPMPVPQPQVQQVQQAPQVQQQVQQTQQQQQVEQQAPQRSPAVDMPTGYMHMPEHLYRWSPDAWGGRILHGVPDLLIEREGRSKVIIFVLVAPAFGRNRAGRIVSLPEGARVAVEVSIAWAAVVPLAKLPQGRPVICAAPTVVDPRTGRVRPAGPEDRPQDLLRFETGDGAYEYGMVIMYDPDPQDPQKPRLISIETLRGAQQNSATSREDGVGRTGA